MTIHILVNPVAGQGKAPDFVNTHLVNLLSTLNEPYQIHTTGSARDAGKIGKDLLSRTKDSEILRVIVAGGDGIAHELIEGVMQSTGKDGSVGRWELAILPLGTANALYASLFANGGETAVLPEYKQALGSASQGDITALCSVFSLLSKSDLRRLPITQTHILDSSSHQVEETVTSHIVLSTSLHAALLSDSESLRAEYPGIERFKVAAEKNLPIAFTASAYLKGPVLQYSPEKKEFVEPFTTDEKDGQHILQGPFNYFLSVTLADRLEPTFVIAPTRASHPPGESYSTMDLIVLRPERDPVVRQAGDDEERAAARAKRLGEAMGWAYQNGKHIDMTYVTGGNGETKEGGLGEVVCEVFRCTGFKWIPMDPSHERSHLVCADGSIHTIPSGGQADVGLADSEGDENHGFFVYA